MEKCERTSPKEYTLFILSNILLYYIYYYGAKHMKWELRVKTPKEHYENITNLLVLSTALFFIGNYGGRWNIEMFGIALLSMFGFGALAELPFLKTHISIGTVKKWSFKQLWFFTSMLGLILLFAWYHMYEANRQNIFPIYIISLTLVLLITYGIPFHISEDKNTLHFHHFLLFYILALFTRFNTVLGNIAGAICIGIYIQGSAMYDNRMFISTFLH